ncbi:hypothetical protein MBLNU459_g1988t1 [Dothideomycetes sp. NU459]
MTGVRSARLEALSEQLSTPRPNPGTFESIPRIPSIAAPSTSPRAAGKVVIITGCNSPLGIGRATAHQFAAQGARAVYVSDFDTTHLDTHVREIGQLYPGTEVHARKIDAGDEAQIRGLVKECMDKYGRLDVFFANAGVSGTMERIYDEAESAKNFMATMRVNALSAFLATKYASRAMMVTSKDKPYPAGSIVATASVAGLRSNAGPTDYSASKAAVVSIMQTSAYQLAGTGIRCNAICPGVIETGMTSKMYEMARSRGTDKKIGQLNPLQRGAVADEVARVALFLGSDEASYVNGQAWAVCGGLSAGHPFVPGKLA